MGMHEILIVDGGEEKIASGMLIWSGEQGEGGFLSCWGGRSRGLREKERWRKKKKTVTQEKTGLPKKPCKV